MVWPTRKVFRAPRHMSQPSRSWQCVAKDGCVKAGASAWTKAAKAGIMCHIGVPPGRLHGLRTYAKAYEEPLSFSPADRQRLSCAPVHESLRKSSYSAILLRVRGVASDASVSFVWVNTHNNFRLFDSRSESDG